MKNAEKTEISNKKEVVDSVIFEYVKFLAEKGQYEEVEIFVNDFYKFMDFKSEKYDMYNGIFVFAPLIDEEKLKQNNIKISEEEIDLGFSIQEDGCLVRKIVYSLKSDEKTILGCNFKVLVTFYYGQIETKDIKIGNEILSLVKYPILYPYRFLISYVESEYRNYNLDNSLDDEYNICISKEVRKLVKEIEFDIETPYKNDSIENVKSKLKNAKLTKSKNMFCYPTYIKSFILYNGEIIGNLSERTAKYKILYYILEDGSKSKVYRYLSRYEKEEKITFSEFDFDNLFINSEKMDKFFDILTHEVEEEESPFVSDLMGIIEQSIEINKMYINKSMQLFNYNETINMKNLSKAGIKCTYLKSFSYPKFKLSDNEIRISGSENKIKVDLYEIIYERRKFYIFLENRMKNILAKLSALSLENYDLNVHYFEIFHISMFEITFEDEEKFIREGFYEADYDAWKLSLKNEIKADLSKNSRIIKLLQEKKGGKIDFNSVIYSKSN